MTTRSDYLQISLLGLGRGILVQSLIYPLEVARTHLQLKLEEKAHLVIRNLIREGRLYRGLSFEIVQKIPNAFCWPLMTYLLPSLHKHDVPKPAALTLTAFSIAALNTTVATPLEKGKIVSMIRTFSWKEVYRDGYQGAKAYFARLFVNWWVFLQAQDYFRKQHVAAPTVCELVTDGMKTAFLVSVMAAPFDAANIVTQAGGNPRALLSGSVVRNVYRIWPLRLISLNAHTIASIYLMEWVDRQTIETAS